MPLIGEKIRHRRKELKMSQEQLGELTGLSQKQISKIETHGTDSIWKVKAIAKVLKVPIGDLLEDEENTST